MVLAFSGFQAKLCEKVQKSKPIYHMTYSKPPTKTILFDVMSKLTSSIKEKSMSFAVIVGDHPVYAVILELKGENLL